MCEVTKPRFKVGEPIYYKSELYSSKPKKEGIITSIYTIISYDEKKM